MSYDTEQNRIKGIKYRTRKGLKELGYNQDEIEAMLSGVEWDTVTPSDLIAQVTDPEPAQTEPRAQSPRAQIASPEPQEEEGGLPTWVQNTIAIGVLLCLAFYIFSSSRPS